MALNPTFTNTPTLSKIKLGNDIYYLKDAELRALIETFGNAVLKDVQPTSSTPGDTDITQNGTGLVTSAQVYEYVQSATSSLSDIVGAMHFVGTSTTNPVGTGGPSVSNHSTFVSGDVVLYGSKEFVYDGTNWKELGDEGLWVPKTLTIAGIDLQDNITANELKENLDLYALAHANTASATVSDYATSISGATYTPAGTVTASVTATSTTATLTLSDYTPEGSISGAVIPSGTIGFSEDSSGFQISGTNAQSEVHFTPSTETVLKSVTTAAVAPSFTEGEFTAGSFNKGSAITATTAGITADIDSTDTEMLVFAAASTTSVMSYSATYTPSSKAPDTFNAGSAAVFDTQSVWVTGTTAVADAQTFTGGKIAATFTGNPNGDAFVNATFTGTTATDALVTAVNYDKVSVSNLAFEGTETTITPTLNKGNKTITVSPDAVAPNP